MNLWAEYMPLLGKDRALYEDIGLFMRIQGSLRGYRALYEDIGLFMRI